MLMVAWSGALEHDGAVLGLSAYVGSSQLMGAIEVRPGLQCGEAGRATYRAWTSPAFRDRRIRVALKHGRSVRWIMNHVHCSGKTIRRVRHARYKGVTHAV